MKNIFTVKETDRITRKQYVLNLNTSSYNQVSFGYKSLPIFGPKLWNKLPYHIKSSKNLKFFKRLMKNWDVTRCSSRICE